MALRIEAAPLEGVTKAVFRRAHRALFSGVDRYYSPFLSPSGDGVFSRRELMDVLPENNEGIPLVPQVLTGRAEHFAWAARLLSDMGWKTVDLNLGCPSGTVVSKHKGAGMLADPEELDRLLEGCFSAAARCGLALSVKTRIGLDSPERFPRILEVYDRYPMEELIIHPRLRCQFYRGRVDLEAFAHALSTGKNPVCYNGDLFTAADWAAFHARFPSVERIMLGRGLAANPALAEEVRGGPPLTTSRLKAFHDEIYASYDETIPEDNNLLRRMKELWPYFACTGENTSRPLKAVLKARSRGEYRGLAEAYFACCPVVPGKGFAPPEGGGAGHF